jgi:hypothetical protein
MIYVISYGTCQTVSIVFESNSFMTAPSDPYQTYDDVTTLMATP